MPPRAAGTKPKKPAAAKPLFTSAQRKAKIREQLDRVSDLVEGRGGEINAATAFVLKQNSPLLADTYSTVADQYDWFARYLDQILTGGVWGQFIGVHIAVGIQIGLIRGWIDPEQLPPPLRMMFAPMAPPPPSDEVREAAEKAAQNGGHSRAEQPQAAPPPPPPPKPRAPRTPPKP